MQKIAYVAPMVFVSASSMLFAGTSFIEAVAVGAVSGAVAGAAAGAVTTALIGTPAATAGAAAGGVAGAVGGALAGAAVWAWNALFGPGPAPPKD